MAGDPGPDLELSATRRVRGSPGRVWAALTSKADLEAWWSPEDLRTTVRRLEVRPGGRVEFHVRYVPVLLTSGASETFRAAGIPVTFDLRGQFRDVVVDRRIEFDLTLEIGRAGAGVEMLTRFELAPHGAETDVMVTGSGRDTPHWRTLGQRNLEGQLERLERQITP